MSLRLTESELQKIIFEETKIVLNEKAAPTAAQTAAQTARTPEEVRETNVKRVKKVVDVLLSKVLDDAMRNPFGFDVGEKDEDVMAALRRKHSLQPGDESKRTRNVFETELRQATSIQEAEKVIEWVRAQVGRLLYDLAKQNEITSEQATKYGKEISRGLSLTSEPVKSYLKNVSYQATGVRTDAPPAAEEPAAEEPAATTPTSTLYYRGTPVDEVRKLQKSLKNMATRKGKRINLGTSGPRKDGVDGYFGRKTAAAWTSLLGEEPPKTFKEAQLALSQRTPVVRQGPTSGAAAPASPEVKRDPGTQGQHKKEIEAIEAMGRQLKDVVSKYKATKNRGEKSQYAVAANGYFKKIIQSIEVYQRRTGDKKRFARALSTYREKGYLNQLLRGRVSESRLHQIIREETLNVLKKKQGLNEVIGSAPAAAPAAATATGTVVGTAGGAAGGVGLFAAIKKLVGFYIKQILGRGFGPLIAVHADFKKIWWDGYDFGKTPYIFDGELGKARGLFTELGKAYDAYMNRYISQIQSYDDEDAHNLPSFVFDMATGGIYSWISGTGDTFGYLVASLNEAGWGQTVSKKIMERREQRVKEVNKIIFDYQPIKYVGAESYPSDQLRQTLVKDLDRMLKEEYGMAENTSVTMPFGSAREAKAALMPNLETLIQTHIQLWNGLTNRTEEGEPTETTDIADKGGQEVPRERRQQVAKKAAEVVAVTREKVANIKSEIRERLGELLPREAREDSELWYNWLAGFIKTEQDLEMLGPVLGKWFGEERERILEEGKFILPEKGRSYKNLMNFIKNNAGYVIGDPRRDLSSLERLLDLMDGERRDRRKAKKQVKNLERAAKQKDKIGGKVDKAVGAGKEKKAKRLKAKLKKVKVKEKELKEIIEDEVRKVLDA